MKSRDANTVTMLLWRSLTEIFATTQPSRHDSTSTNRVTQTVSRIDPTTASGVTGTVTR